MIRILGDDERVLLGVKVERVFSGFECDVFHVVFCVVDYLSVSFAIV